MANAAISCAYVVPTRLWAPVIIACVAREAKKKSTKATHRGAGPQSFARNPTPEAVTMPPPEMFPLNFLYSK